MMRPVAELTRRLRADGQKLTSQRLVIWEYLHGNTGHPTAEQVYESVRQQLPAISLTTVYKILNELVEMGEVVRLDLGDGAARFDPNTEGHIHARCARCGAVLDLEAAAAPVCVPDRVGGFCVRGYRLVLEGECQPCASI